MPIFWSAVWGLTTLCTMFVTIRYYLPGLARRLQRASSGSPSASAELPEAGACRSALLNRPLSAALTLAVCSCYAAWCGYQAALHTLSLIAMLKMLLGMTVLACAFITDLELMIIPNLCSLILLGGRLVFCLWEFLAAPQQAPAMILSSFVIMAGCFVFLLIMSRVTKGGIGMGDVKLFSTMGFLCGIYAVCYTLVFAFGLCALFSVLLLIMRKKKLKDTLPLGPFIWMGYGIAVLLAIM